MPTSSSKSKTKSTKKSTKTVKTGKKYIPKKDLKEKLKTFVSTSELIDQSDMKVRPKRTIKNEQICAGCSVSFNSPWDKTLILNDEYQWVGCDEEGFKFWSHAFCAGIQIGKKDPKNIDFFCPNHIKS